MRRVFLLPLILGLLLFGTQQGRGVLWLFLTAGGLYSAKLAYAAPRPSAAFLALLAGTLLGIAVLLFFFILYKYEDQP